MGEEGERGTDGDSDFWLYQKLLMIPIPYYTPSFRVLRRR